MLWKELRLTFSADMPLIYRNIFMSVIAKQCSLLFEVTIYNYGIRVFVDAATSLLTPVPVHHICAEMQSKNIDPR